MVEKCVQMPADKNPRSGNFLSDFGRYIKKRRGEESLSQQSLGELSNVSDRTIREIEMGKGRETLQARIFENLLHALDGQDGDRKFQEFRRRLLEEGENGDDRNENERPDAPSPRPSQTEPQISHSKKSRVRLGMGAALAIGALAMAPLVLDSQRNSESNRSTATEGVGQPHSKPNAAGVTDRVQIPANPARTQAEPTFEIQATLRDGRLDIFVRPEFPSRSARPAHLELSRDGVAFERASHLSNFLPSSKLFVRLRRSEADATAGPFDLTGQAMTATRQTLSQIVECHVGVCTLPARSLCKRQWSELSLGRRASRPEFSVDLESCEHASERLPSRLCFSTPHDLFPFDEDQPLFAALRSRTGGTFEFSVPIKKTNRRFDFDNVSSDARHKLAAVSPAADTPPAATWFVPAPSIQPHPFRIDIGVASCGRDSTTPMTDFLGLETGFNAIYYDVDGKGYVKGQRRYFGIPVPSRDVIDILLKGKDGKTYGPYRYKFDSNEIVQKAIAAAQKPIDLDCRIKLGNRLDPTSWRYNCSGPTRDRTLLNWARVKEIHVGSSPDSLPHKIRIDLNSKSILERTSYHAGKTAMPVFEFSPPKDQKDLYFLLHYRDGTKSILQRLQLPERY